MVGVLVCQTAGAGTGFFVRQMLRAEKLIPEDHEEPPIVPLPADHVGAYLELPFLASSLPGTRQLNEVYEVSVCARP